MVCLCLISWQACCLVHNLFYVWVKRRLNGSVVSFVHLLLGERVEGRC